MSEIYRWILLKTCFGYQETIRRTLFFLLHCYYSFYIHRNFVMCEVNHDSCVPFFSSVYGVTVSVYADTIVAAALLAAVLRILCFVSSPGTNSILAHLLFSPTN